MTVRGTISASGIKKSYDRTVILGGVDVVVAPSTRVGLVGPNGIGKSTLLRILAGRLAPDAGTVRRDPPGLNVGYLSQEPDVSGGETVYGYLARRTGIARAEAEVDALAEQLGADERVAERYAQALDRFVALGGGDLRTRAEATLAQVGLEDGVLDQEAATLSGGQAARAQLAAILLSRFDTLLLDEPTNNLDFDGLDLLETFCLSHTGGLAVVSHDRAFLDRVVTQIVEITEPDRESVTYTGGWSEYVEQRELARRHAYEAHEKYTGERDRIRSGMQRQREWSARGVGKLKKKRGSAPKIVLGAMKDRTEKQASKIRSMERRLEHMERNKVDKPWEPWDLQLEIAETQRSGKIVARLEEAVVRRGTFELGPISLEVEWAQRLAILGPNGTGKSTMIDAILGRVPLAEGRRMLGPGVVVGEIDQTRTIFDGRQALIDVFVSDTQMQPGEARTLLAKFGLQAEHVLRACDTLSPGERTRAGLAMLMARGVNCLVLDEPTNHLDLQAIEQLESALRNFEGTMLLVTHDRYMLEAVEVDRTIQLG